MPWSPIVTHQFEKVINHRTTDGDFHGAYNKLLYTTLPAKFTVSRGVTDFLVLFDTSVDDKPVLIVEIKAPTDIIYADKRDIADRQIRDRIRDTQDECPLDVLHAVLAMGTRLCFYRKPRGDPIHPPLIDGSGSLQVDTAPVERWDCDILEEDGMQRFQAMLDEIKWGCDALV